MKRRAGLVSGAISLWFGLSYAAQAQHIYFDPRTEARVTFTDNANLTETDRLYDGVLNSAIGLNARIDGNRLDAAIDYSLDHFLFFSDQSDDFRQNLFGTLDAEVIENHFNIIGRASLRQQFLDQRGSLSGSAANRTANRRLVQNYSGTAVLKGGLRDLADWRLTYRYGLQFSPADNLSDTTLPINFSDTQTQDITASVGSGDRFNALEWRLFAESSRVTRNLDVNDFRNDRAGGELRFKFNRHIQLIGSANVSSNDFQTDVLSQDGFGWEAGFRWTPGRKLDLTATYGKVGDRDIFYVALQHFFSVRFDFSGTYTDTITANSIVSNDNLNSLQFNAEGGISTVDRLPIDETDPNFSFSDVDFRRQIASGTFTLRQKRTTSFLNGFIERRTFDDSSGVGRARGVTLGVDHDINPRTELSARLSWRQSLFEDDIRRDSFIVGNVSWTKRIAKHLSFSVSYDHSTRISNEQGQDLRENALSIYIRGIF